MQGIAEVVLSTYDIDRTAEALVAVGAFRRVVLPDAESGHWDAWHLEPGCTRISQALLLPETGTRGALRLVCFHGVERQRIRPAARAWDTGGIFDVDVFSRDARATYRALRKFGWSAFGEPVDYRMGEFDVTQVIVTGPDGLVVAIIEPHRPPSFDVHFAAMSRLFNSTQMVRDMDAALAFYCDTLGWKALVDLTVEDTVEPGADVLGLPMPFARTARRRVAIVHPTGSNDGSIELIQIVGWEGHDFAERATAPNVGLLALRLPVANVADLAAEIRDRGGTLYAEPRRLEIAPIGEVPFFSVRSPDGAILEFYEPAAIGEASS